MNEMQHACDEDNPEKAPDGEDNAHRNNRSAKAAQDTDGAVVDCQDKSEQCCDFQLRGTIINDLWIGTE